MTVGDASRARPAPPPTLAGIAERVEARLRTVLDDEVARWRRLDADLVAPLEALSRLVLAGGKRLRPAFCHWGWVGAGGEPDSPVVVDAGAAFELLQAFALIHDDVMDDSSVRRGERTVHLQFATHLRDAGWHGEDRRFGEGVAILVGDLAHVYADRLLAGAPRRALEVWDELRIELNVGQYLDVLGTVRRGTDLPTARRIAVYKSGRYTIERPLQVGAALAGRYDELAEPLSAYGRPLGEAFQLRDDILGAFGDQALTGKPVGDDLREGKPTPLLAVAVERADARQAAVLARIGRRDLDAAAVEELQEVFEATGARAAIEADVARLADEAIAAADRAPVPDEVRDELVALAHYVAAREH